MDPQPDPARPQGDGWRWRWGQDGLQAESATASDLERVKRILSNASEFLALLTDAPNPSAETPTPPLAQAHTGPTRITSELVERAIKETNMYVVHDHSDMRLKMPWSVANPAGIFVAKFDHEDDAYLFAEAASQRHSRTRGRHVLDPPSVADWGAGWPDEMEIFKSAVAMLGGFARGILAQQLSQLVDKLAESK